MIGIDMYNALNSSAILTYNNTFVPGGTWLQPLGGAHAAPRCETDGRCQAGSAAMARACGWRWWFGRTLLAAAIVVANLGVARTVDTFPKPREKRVLITCTRPGPTPAIHHRREQAAAVSQCRSGADMVVHYSEFIDTTRFPNARTAPAEFLRLKYEGIRFDPLVIAIQDEAVDFVERERDSAASATHPPSS